MSVPGPQKGREADPIFVDKKKQKSYVLLLNGSLGIKAVFVL